MLRTPCGTGFAGLEPSCSPRDTPPAVSAHVAQALSTWRTRPLHSLQSRKRPPTIRVSKEFTWHRQHSVGRNSESMEGSPLFREKIFTHSLSKNKASHHALTLSGSRKLNHARSIAAKAAENRHPTRHPVSAQPIAVSDLSTPRTG